MSEAITIRLEKNIPEIMKQWVERADIEVRSAKHQESLVLKNSLPEYLSHLASVLSETIHRNKAQRSDAKKESTRVGKKHGKERAQAVNYTIDQLILEYHILRQIIFEVLEKETPINSNEREVIVCSIEQAVNDAATQFNETLRELQEKVSHTLAHDLRTPLASARMNAQIITRKPDDIKMHLKKASEIIDSIDRVDRMIRELLDASRLKAGESLTLEFKKFDLNELVHTISTEMNQAYSDRIVVNSEQQCWGIWDESALRRVIENITTNAFKYSHDNTPITITVSQDASTAKVSIHNEGNPISHEDQKLLFQQFKRSSSAEKEVGWGLGLTVVKGMIEAHDGNVMVHSEEDEGTSFEFTIPKNRIDVEINQ